MSMGHPVARCAIILVQLIMLMRRKVLHIHVDRIFINFKNSKLKNNAAVSQLYKVIKKTPQDAYITIG